MSEQQINQENTVVEETISTPTEVDGSYPLDREQFEIKINIFPSADKPHYVYHVLRKPTFEDEEARERKMPLISTDVGKVEGGDASTTTMDVETGNSLLYDKIIVGVKGYALQKGEKPSKDLISPDQVVVTPDGEKTVKELIPLSHKSTAIEGMFPSMFELDEEGAEEFIFALGGGREWRIKQEIGGKYKREDGTLAPADYTIYYTFREPTEAERKNFRAKGIIAMNVRTKTGFSERRSVNLKVLKELFESMILSVEKATIDGKPVDVRDRSQVEQIPATFKKGSILKLFALLEADLGN